MLIHFADNTETRIVSVCQEDDVQLEAARRYPGEATSPNEPYTGHGGGGGGGDCDGETMVCHVVFSLFCRVNFYQFRNIYFLVVCEAFSLYCLTNFYFLLVCITLFFPLVIMATRQAAPHVVFVCTQ